MSWLLLLALAAGLLGCGERARVWEQPLSLRGPYKLRSQVVWLEASRGLVVALEPGVDGQPPRLHHTRMRRNASFAVPTPDGEALLVLSTGKEALYRDQEAEEAGLSVLRVVAGSAPEVTRFYPLSGAFDRLALSADGQLAVAHYTSGQGNAGVFRNPNEVALIDLGEEPGPENPFLRTVRSFGSAPFGVIFSPPMAVPAPSGPQRTLAVVLAQNAVTFLDLTHKERREITVPLAKPDAAAQILPQQVLFSPSTGTVLVRADGAADLYSLSLQPQTAVDPDDNDYRPSINQPSSGKTPRDMVLFADAGKDLILTANSSQDLSLIEAASSQFSVIPLATPVDTLLPVPADAPQLVIAYSARKPSTDVYFVKLAGLSSALSQNLTRRKLEKPVFQLLAMPDSQQALVVHNDQRTVVSVLDLVGQYHTISPIQGQLPLQSFDFAEGPLGSYLAGVSSGLSELGLLDLSNLHPVRLRLDQNPRRVLAVGESLIIDHEQLPGVVTVVPNARATRDESFTFWGIFLDGLFDDELRD